MYQQEKDEAARGVPPHWLTYFAVAECDAAANKALKLGAIIRLDVPA